MGKKSERLDQSKWLAIGTLATAAATALFAYWTYSLDEIERRAWIAPGKLEPSEIFFDKPPRDTHITIKYKNTGGSPAENLNLKLLASGVIAQTDIPSRERTLSLVEKLLDGKSCNQLGLDYEGHTIYPNAEAGLQLPISASDLEKVFAGTHNPIVVGCIVYQSLRTIKWSELCRIYAQEAGTPNKWETIYCRAHNGNGGR